MAEKALDAFEKARKRSVSFLERTDSPSLLLSVSASKNLDENIEKIDVSILWSLLLFLVLSHLSAESLRL